VKDRREYFWPTKNQYLSSNLLSVEGSMIDAVLNVALSSACSFSGQCR